MKNGTPVRLIQPEIRGVVTERRINKLTDELELKVEWFNAEGQPVARWFDNSQLEAVAAEEPTQEGA